jgi:hypothetical protein
MKNHSRALKWFSTCKISIDLQVDGFVSTSGGHACNFADDGRRSIGI